MFARSRCQKSCLKMRNPFSLVFPSPHQRDYIRSCKDLWESFHREIRATIASCLVPLWLCHGPFVGIYCFEISNRYEKMPQVLSCSIDSSVRLLLQSLLSNSCRGTDLRTPLLCARECTTDVSAKSRLVYLYRWSVPLLRICQRGTKSFKHI